MDGGKATKKKQPKGLKRSLAKQQAPSADITTTHEPSPAKKLKTDGADDNSNTQEQQNEDTAVIQLPEDGSQDAPPTEVQILRTLYDTAIEKHTAGDLLAAQDLFRGCVHECDKALRVRAGQFPDMPVPEEPLTPDFYLVYGNALMQVGTNAEDGSAEKEQLGGLLDAAVERLEEGLAIARGGEDAERELRVSLGKVLLEKATLHLERSGPSPTITTLTDRALKHFNIPSLLFVSISDKANDLNFLPTVLDVASACQRFASVCAGGAGEWEVCEKWNDRAKELYGKALEVSTSSSEALIGIGACSLALAGELLALAEDRADEAEEESSDAPEGTEKVISHLNNASDHFNRVEKLLGASEIEKNASLLTMLAETNLNLGNIYDVSDDEKTKQKATEHYKKAVAYFRAVGKADPEHVLDEGLREFVDELEKGLAEEEKEQDA
ncbi:hypothetical protein HKX48_003268 [Thoreauomyces humboldtii]|nr:hypothetical protein HKX48_003268 [Thoreauomyces humboldtii]